MTQFDLFSRAPEPTPDTPPLENVLPRQLAVPLLDVPSDARPFSTRTPPRPLVTAARAFCRSTGAKVAEYRVQEDCAGYGWVAVIVPVVGLPRSMTVADLKAAT